MTTWHKQGKRTVVVILLLLLPLFYISLYKPLKYELDQAILNNYQLVTQAKAQTLNQFVQRSQEGAESLSSRSAIRDRLASYTAGDITWEELQTFTTPKYMDGVNALGQVAYAGRWVQGEALVETDRWIDPPSGNGVVESLEAYFTMNSTTQVFLTVPDQWLGVYSPILKGEDLLGYDLVMIDIVPLLMDITTDAVQVELLQQSDARGVWVEEGVAFAQHQIPALEGVVLQTYVESDHLFGNINRINRNNVIIFMLGFSFAIGFIYKVMKRDASKAMKQLQRAKEDADAANLAKSRYLAHMNHEMRTPLNGLLGFLQILDGTQLDDAQKEYMHHMKQTSSHLMSIINNVLDHAKIEAGRMQLEKRLFNLTEEVNMAMAPLRSLALEKNIELEVNLDNALPKQVVGDPDRIRQIILNLGGNAIKFTQEGQVKIDLSCTETRADRHLLKLVVEDTGPGMNQETLDKLFQPFYQADDGTVRQSKGTGLGMNISQELAQLMDGGIDVNSTLGKGTRMEVRLEVNREQGKSSMKSLETTTEA